MNKNEIQNQLNNLGMELAYTEHHTPNQKQLDNILSILIGLDSEYLPITIKSKIIRFKVLCETIESMHREKRILTEQLGKLSEMLLRDINLQPKNIIEWDNIIKLKGIHLKGCELYGTNEPCKNSNCKILQNPRTNEFWSINERDRLEQEKEL
jgi:hypothetical protein